MTHLTPELIKKFGELYVTVDSDIEAAHEKAQLNEKGATLFVAQMDRIQTIFMDLGQPIPKLFLCLGEQPASLFYEKKQPFIRINPLKASASKELQRILDDYIKQHDTVDSAALEQAPGGKTIREFDRPSKGQVTSGFGLHGMRGNYDLTKPPNPELGQCNTRAQLKDYRYMYKNEPESWKFWLEVVFNQENLEKTPPHVFLRHVRILAGVGIKDVGTAIGWDNSHYSQYENNKVGDGQLPLKTVLSIIKKNPFRWPVDVHGKVEARYAEAFLDKMGIDPRSMDLETGKLRPEWLEKQPYKKQSGLLLKNFRECAGLTRKQLGDKLGISVVTVAGYEVGERRIPLQRFDSIAEAIGLQEGDHEWLRKLVTPVSVEPLSKDWLEKQPPEKQAGLLLRNLRQRAGLTQKELANKIEVSKFTLGMYENGQEKIPVQRIDLIAEALGLQNEDHEWLRKLVTPAPIQPLSKDWLEKQPPEKQAGILLRNLRQRAGLTLNELADKIEVSKSAICWYEVGGIKILPKYLDKFTEVFSELEGFDKNYFVSIVEKSNHAIRLMMKPNKTGLGGIQKATPDLLPPEPGQEVTR